MLVDKSFILKRITTIDLHSTSSALTLYNRQNKMWKTIFPNLSLKIWLAIKFFLFRIQNWSALGEVSNIVEATGVQHFLS